MNLTIEISSSDPAALDAVQRGLLAHGVDATRRTRVDVSATGLREVVQVTRAGPELVDAIFDSIERFLDRIDVLIDRRPARITDRRSLELSIRQPDTFVRLFGRQ